MDNLFNFYVESNIDNDTEIYVHGKDQLSIIINKILNMSESTLDVYVDNINDKILFNSLQFLHELENFFEKGNHIRIILQYQDKKYLKESAIYKILENNKDNCILKFINKDENVFYNDFHINFIVSEPMFCLITDPVNGVAFAKYNDINNSKVLKSIFEDLIKNKSEFYIF